MPKFYFLSVLRSGARIYLFPISPGLSRINFLEAFHGPYYRRRLPAPRRQPFSARADGYEPLVDSKNKEVVTALREIAAGKVLPEDKRFYTPVEGETTPDLDD